METLLSEVEGWGSVIVDELISQPDSLDPQQAAKFAWFLAFQFTRGMAQREDAVYLESLLQASVREPVE